MSWECAAIDHGVTVFANGKIGPCPIIRGDYLKPIAELTNPDRFADLKTEHPPSACDHCISAEHSGLPSNRQTFARKKTSAPGLQFVDIRNTNHCNLKCRYCGPHFSSSWAKELGDNTVTRQDIQAYKDTLFTDDLNFLYFTGGEPLINPEHWSLLTELVESGRANSISLLYHTNLTTIKHKNIDIIDLWKHFKSVNIQCSIDAVGLPLEYIRSGTEWEKIESNLHTLLSSVHKSTITITLAPVISILNIWFIAELYEYANKHRIAVIPTILSGPDYLALDVIPDELKPLALEQVNKIKAHVPAKMHTYLTNKLENNINNCLFSHTVSHILLLDNVRKENLFDLLPFKDIAITNFIKIYAYE